jgi:hypothetical protein
VLVSSYRTLLFLGENLLRRYHEYTMLLSGSLLNFTQFRMK